MVNSWRALIADDSAMNKKMLKRLLEDYFRVVNAREACDGLEDIHAVEAALQDKRSEKPFGVILTDCIIHVMDGDEATMKIRKLAKYCR
jgi:CheY-like chemotaxis protein